MKTVTKGQYFVTIDDAELARADCSFPCREYTLPRDDDTSRPKGWIRGNTKICGTLEVTVTFHVIGRWSSIFGYDLQKKEQIRNGNVERK